MYTPVKYGNIARNTLGSKESLKEAVSTRILLHGNTLRASHRLKPLIYDQRTEQKLEEVLKENTRNLDKPWFGQYLVAHLPKLLGFFSEPQLPFSHLLTFDNGSSFDYLVHEVERNFMASGGFRDNKVTSFACVLTPINNKLVFCYVLFGHPIRVTDIALEKRQTNSTLKDFLEVRVHFNYDMTIVSEAVFVPFSSQYDVVKLRIVDIAASEVKLSGQIPPSAGILTVRSQQYGSCHHALKIIIGDKSRSGNQITHQHTPTPTKTLVRRRSHDTLSLDLEDPIEIKKSRALDDSFTVASLLSMLDMPNLKFKPIKMTTEKRATLDRRVSSNFYCNNIIPGAEKPNFFATNLSNGAEFIYNRPSSRPPLHPSYTSHNSHRHYQPTQWESIHQPLHPHRLPSPFSIFVAESIPSPPLQTLLSATPAITSKSSLTSSHLTLRDPQGHTLSLTSAHFSSLFPSSQQPSGNILELSRDFPLRIDSLQRLIDALEGRAGRAWREWKEIVRAAEIIRAKGVVERLCLAIVEDGVGGSGREGYATGPIARLVVIDEWQDFRYRNASNPEWKVWGRAREILCHRSANWLKSKEYLHIRDQKLPSSQSIKDKIKSDIEGLGVSTKIVFLELMLAVKIENEWLETLLKNSSIAMLSASIDFQFQCANYSTFKRGTFKNLEKHSCFDIRQEVLRFHDLEMNVLNEPISVENCIMVDNLTKYICKIKSHVKNIVSQEIVAGIRLIADDRGILGLVSSEEALTFTARVEVISSQTTNSAPKNLLCIIRPGFVTWIDNQSYSSHNNCSTSNNQLIVTIQIDTVLQYLLDYVSRMYNNFLEDSPPPPAIRGNAAHAIMQTPSQGEASPINRFNKFETPGKFSTPRHIPISPRQLPLSPRPHLAGSAQTLSVPIPDILNLDFCVTPTLYTLPQLPAPLHSLLFLQPHLSLPSCHSIPSSLPTPPPWVGVKGTPGRLKRLEGVREYVNLCHMLYQFNGIYELWGLDAECAKSTVLRYLSLLIEQEKEIGGVYSGERINGNNDRFMSSRTKLLNPFDSRHCTPIRNDSHSPKELEGEFRLPPPPPSLVRRPLDSDSPKHNFTSATRKALTFLSTGLSTLNLDQLADKAISALDACTLI